MSDRIEKWRNLIPNDLLESFNSTDPPVIFIGSGFGKEAIPPIKTGTELANELQNELGIAGDGESLAELLQYLKNTRAGSRSSITQWLKQHLGYNDSIPGGGYFLLLYLPCKEIFTTNYDDLLIQATSNTHQRLIPIDDPNSYQGSFVDVTRSNNKKLLVRMHGAFEMESNIIATTDDYISFYSDTGTKWKDILMEKLKNDRVIFIGYSIRDFTTWTSYINVFEKWKGWTKPHALIAPTDNPHLKPFWNNYGIQYIPLKAHEFLIGIHDYLGNIENRDNTDVVLAAASACVRQNIDDTFNNIEQYRQTAGYSCFTSAAIKFVERENEN